MRFPMILRTIAGSSVLLVPLAACAVDPAPPIDESPNDVEPLFTAPVTRTFGQGQVGVDTGVWAKALISGNGLSPDALHPGGALNALRTLGNQALSSANINGSGITGETHGTALIEYAIQCALPAGVSRTIVTPGGVTTFYGHVGLAPSWGTAPATAEEKRWVSACLLAHANAWEARVNIMLMGRRSSLERSPATATLERWGFQEAAFYGDLFMSPLPVAPKPYMFACTGYDAQNDCEDAVEVSLNGRFCGRRSDCRFSIVGPCNGIRTTEEACGPYGAAYDDCARELQPRGGSFPVKEVITVFLRSSADVATMHPKCAAPEFDSAVGGVDLCVPGPELAPGTHQCVTEVCEADPSCCTVAWDSKCVEKIGSVCGTPCGAPEHSFCEFGPPLYVYGSPEANLVCSDDPFCCDVMWDQECVSAAEDVGFCP